MKKLAAVIAALSMLLTLSACRDDYTREGGQITTANIEELKLATETTVVEDELFADGNDTTETTETSETTAATVDLVLDREGTLVGVPAEVNRIASGSERITQLLVELGLGGKIVCADKSSAGVAGVTPAICTLNKKIITASSLEQYAPDVVIIDGNSTDPMFSSLKEAGVNVICIPEPTSIEAVKLDIMFLAEYFSVDDKGQLLTDEIDKAVAEVTERAKSITAKRKVYLETQAAPEMKGCGDGTIAGEILDIAGGINMLAGQNGIVAVTSESVVTANPNVILTIVSADGYDFNEIRTRTGWGNIKAVKNNTVRQISISDTAALADSIYEAAKAIYPEIFKD